MSKQEQYKDLDYWKKNAEEDYIITPISVLKYISEIEKQFKEVQEEKDSYKNDVLGLIDSLKRAYVGLEMPLQVYKQINLTESAINKTIDK